MPTEAITKTFKQFQQTNQKRELAVWLAELLASGQLSDTDACWAYWNISDQWAMLRESDAEFTNHQQFEKQLLQMDKTYWHWIVSDATQNLTLLVGGYESYWNDLYDTACKEAPQTAENAILRFEAHRATAKIPRKIPYPFDKEHSLLALDNLKRSAEELAENKNGGFCRLTYYTHAIGSRILLGDSHKPLLDDAQNTFESLLPLLRCPTEKKPCGLIGTWQQLNSFYTPHDQAVVGAKNYIVQLINAGEYALALHCYGQLAPCDQSSNSYFRSKIDLAQSMI